MPHHVVDAHEEHAIVPRLHARLAQHVRAVPQLLRVVAPRPGPLCAAVGVAELDEARADAEGSGGLKEAEDAVCMTLDKARHRLPPADSQEIALVPQQHKLPPQLVWRARKEMRPKGEKTRHSPHQIGHADSGVPAVEDSVGSVELGEGLLNQARPQFARSSGPAEAESIT